jgi:hypothetical protein
MSISLACSVRVVAISGCPKAANVRLDARIRSVEVRIGMLRSGLVRRGKIMQKLTEAEREQAVKDFGDTRFPSCDAYESGCTCDLCRFDDYYVIRERERKEKTR